MLATNGFDTNWCLDKWLGYYSDHGGGNVEDSRAGKNASTRTLRLANEEVYKKLVANESTSTWITDYWKANPPTTTINYMNNQ